MTDDMLDLDLIPELGRADAVEALDAGDVRGFLIEAQGGARLTIVFDNFHALKARGLYEEALLIAWTAPKFNHSHVPEWALKFMLERASREKLRALGDPLPGPGPFVLYRGVAGGGKRRRERGFSWSDDFERAKWFADRGNLMELRNPAVVSTTVQADEVLVFLRDGEYGRTEREFILLPPPEVSTVWTGTNPEQRLAQGGPPNMKKPRRNLKLVSRCFVAMGNDDTRTETLRSILGKRVAREAERFGLEDRVMRKVGEAAADPKALAALARALKVTTAKKPSRAVSPLVVRQMDQAQ